MKKYKLLILLSTVTLICNGQPYSHYLDHSVRWNLLSVDFAPPLTYYYYHSYYLNGDTVINGKSYFKMYDLKKDSISNGVSSSVTNTGTKYWGGIREDSTNKFFFKPAYPSAPEYLQSDFSLKINDPFPGGGSTCFVSKIDTVYFDGIPLKRFYTPDLVFGDKIIEGVGDQGFWLICGFPIHSGESLICYSKQGKWLQLDTLKSCAGFLTPPKVVSVAENESHFHNIKVFPNPVSRTLNIDFSEESTKLEFTLYSVYGKIEVSKKASNGRLTIDVSSLPMGIYIMEFKSGKSIWRERLVKEY